MDLIKKYEGLELKAYKCPAGIWTIGYGTTEYTNGAKVKEGDIITETEAEYLIFSWVDRNCGFIYKMGLTPNQELAVISLVYNIGKNAFLRSNLYNAIIDKDYKQIAKNWDWFSANGKVLKGLVKRRCEELNLFMQDI